MKKRITALLLCLLLLVPSLVGAAMAEENTVRIRTVEDLIKLSENCVTDSWSAGRTILLENDINLTGVDFSPIPLMAGTFDGQGHSIIGFSFDADGSTQGLFRCVLPGGVIRRLKVCGSINAGGEGKNIGGVVGVNFGRLSNCSFEGDIRGVGAVGGVVGLNCESGYLSFCAVTGEILGEHRVGGVVGENRGSIEKCSSSASINTEHFVVENQTSFDISSLSLSTETLVDITDIGGVAGLNSGSMSTCTNTGAVGYPHIGYNIGGIAGRQNGRIYNCTNRGEVIGRKDVGGVVGQLEPHSEWNFTGTGLAQLQSQLYALEGSVNAMLGNIGMAMGEARLLLNSAMDVIRDSGNIVGDMVVVPELPGVEPPGGTAEGTTGSGTGDGGLPGLPDFGGINPGDWYDRNSGNTDALIHNLQELITIMGAVNNVIDGQALVYDMQVVVSQLMGVSSTMVNMMYDLMNSVGDSVKVTDVSGNENEDETQCIVARCKNMGDVTADTNVGGIAGAVALDVAFDREDKLGVSSFIMGNSAYEVYARVLECENYAGIRAEKSCAGGIAGRMDYGLVLESCAAGNVEAAERYAGGIAGYSAGSIRACAARVNLQAGSYVGGIAGLGKDIADCRAMPHIEEYAEFMGSVAGFADGSVSGNFYADSKVGGVDGFSFTGQSDYMEYDSFVALKSTPNAFKSITITFMAEGKPIQAVDVPFGGSVEKLPAVEDKDGMYWQWEEFDNDGIYYSITVEGEYVRPITTIATDEEEPLFLAEGVFRDKQTLSALPFAPDCEALGLDEEDGVLGYTLRVSDYGDGLTLRMLMPDSGRLYELKGGVLSPLNYTRERSYIVFRLDNGSSVVWQSEGEISRSGAIAGIAAAAAAAVSALVVLLVVKKRKAKPDTAGKDTETVKE